MKWPSAERGSRERLHLSLGRGRRWLPSSQASLHSSHENTSQLPIALESRSSNIQGPLLNQILLAWAIKPPHLLIPLEFIESQNHEAWRRRLRSSSPTVNSSLFRRSGLNYQEAQPPIETSLARAWEGCWLIAQFKLQRVVSNGSLECLIGKLIVWLFV